MKNLNKYNTVVDLQSLSDNEIEYIKNFQQ